ncbi:MAG: hypothetical protein GY754_05650 [bacterium]|nr:hypothetical protein [bacterium]
MNWTKISTKLNNSCRAIGFIFILSIVLLSCGKLKGEFAVKKFHDEVYRRAGKTLEFRTDETIDWIFSFKSVSGGRRVGVILMKKELIWVDIKTTISVIDASNSVIFGTIKDLPVGDYRIVLTDIEEKNAIIDSKNFLLYSDEEELE